MALISCPECGKEISDKAFACPHCGNPMNQPTPKHTNNNGWSKGSKKRLLYVLIGIILICIIGGAWFLLRFVHVEEVSENKPVQKEIDISKLDSNYSIENVDEAASNELADGEVVGEARLEKHDVNIKPIKKDTLLILAEQGDADAQYTIGYRYYVGDRVSKDKSKAVYWFRKSAEQGYRFALYKLGFCYYHGEGVSKDYSKAVSCFHKAAYLHDIAAYYYLGICYKNGDGVPKDYSKAVSWFRKAADQGYADAQYHLGLCYDNGEGVPKNESKAVYWYIKAANQGNSKANSMLVSVNSNEKSQKKNDVKKQEKSQALSSKSESSTSSSRSISSSSSSSNTSQSSSSSGSNGNSGNKTTTVVVEHHHTPVPVTEWVPCGACGFNPGVCQTCVGMGESASGRRCISCRGTGRCHFCNGQGGRYQTVYR